MKATALLRPVAKHHAYNHTSTHRKRRTRSRRSSKTWCCRGLPQAASVLFFSRLVIKKQRSIRTALRTHPPTRPPYHTTHYTDTMATPTEDALARQQNLDIHKHLSMGTNPRGIPTAAFIVSKISRPPPSFPPSPPSLPSSLTDDSLPLTIQIGRCGRVPSEVGWGASGDGHRGLQRALWVIKGREGTEGEMGKGLGREGGGLHGTRHVIFPLHFLRSLIKFALLCLYSCSLPFLVYFLSLRLPPFPPSLPPSLPPSP